MKTKPARRTKQPSQMCERVAVALQECQARLGWSNAKVASEIGVGEMSIRNYCNRVCEPSVTTYQAMRERIPGFADLVDAKAAA